ncbi:hypothetical protein LI325_16715 [Enterocloster lavalensis]|nr:hypothetical protein [Enterocloster lavalensis]
MTCVCNRHGLETRYAERHDVRRGFCFYSQYNCFGFESAGVCMACGTSLVYVCDLLHHSGKYLGILPNV